MAKSRWKYYVAIEICYSAKPSEFRYVTEIDNENKISYWKDGEMAMPMSLAMAESITEGLCMNFFRAFIIKAPCTFEFMNPTRKEEQK